MFLPSLVCNHVPCAVKYTSALARTVCKLMKMNLFTGWPNNGTVFLVNALTLSNINRFSKFFHSRNREKICNNIITKDPTTPQVCRCTTLCWGQQRLCHFWGPPFIYHVVLSYLTFTTLTSVQYSLAFVAKQYIAVRARY